MKENNNISALIGNNPFRILGVFANASKKEIAANVNKLQAFAKVGKPTEFPSDFVSMLGGLTRTQETICEAEKAIERPMDKLRASIFWFVNLTPIDSIAFNHVFLQDIAKAKNIWSKKECESSLLNLSICCLLEDDLLSAAGYMEKLIFDYRKEFLMVVDETLNLSSSDLANLYLDSLAGNNIVTLEKLIPQTPTTLFETLSNAPTSRLVDIVKAKVVNLLNSQVNNEISKSQAIKAADPVARLRAGQSLIALAHIVLKRIKAYSGTSSIEFVSLSDKLAQEILQCGIDYYNNTNREQSDPEAALEVQETALRIAQGELVKSRCQKNVDIMHDIVAKMPPKSVRYYHRLLERCIDKYKENKPTLSGITTLSSVIAFIKACAPYLMSIKTALGAANEYYVHISTQVASDALNDVIANYNELSKHSKTNKSKSLSQQRDLVRLALIAIQTIQCLDLDLDFRTKRITPNFRVLWQQACDIHIIGTNAMDVCQMGASQYAQYDIKHELEECTIDKRDEDGYFKSIRSIEDCYIYRSVFPNGKYTQAVRDKEEAFEYGDCQTIEDLSEFRHRYPNTRFDLDEKKDDIEYASCKSRDDYSNYVSLHPNGRHRVEALQHIDEIDYTKCQVLHDYEEYLTQHPCGRYFAAAKQRIKEETLWNQCKLKKSRTYYKEYLAQYPNGQHVSEATQKARQPIVQIWDWCMENSTTMILCGITVAILIVAAAIKGLIGVACALIVGAFISFFFILCQSKWGCGTRLLAIGVCAIVGFSGYYLADWWSRLDMLNGLSADASRITYRTFISNNFAKISKQQQEEVLHRYYRSSLDSCYATLARYSAISNKTSSLSGLGYIKDFIWACPITAYKEEAELRYQALVDSLYAVASNKNDYEGWGAYQAAVASADYRDSSDKRQAADTRWNTDDNAWRTVSATNDITSYQKYLSLYPKGKHIKEANKRIIDLEVDATFKSEYGELPTMEKMSSGNSVYTTIIIYNKTEYKLTLLYSGLESRRLEIFPQDYQTINLTNGVYRVAASVNASNISKYAGNEKLDGGICEVTYYISTTNY